MAYKINIWNFINMKLIKNKVKIFNLIKLALLPHWLIKPENYKGKLYSSIILIIFLEKEAQKAIKNGLIINGKSIKITKFKKIKPTNQYKKCQKLGHFFKNYIGIPKCQYCGMAHFTKNHHYYIY